MLIGSQHVHVPSLLIAEMKIRAHHHVGCLEKSGDHIPDKILRAHLAEALGKGAANQIVHLSLQMPLSFLLCHQHLVRAVQTPAQGLHVKGTYNAVQPVCPAVFCYFLHKLLMSLVQAVKFPQRHSAPACRAEGLQSIYILHCDPFFVLCPVLPLWAEEHLFIFVNMLFLLIAVQRNEPAPAVVHAHQLTVLPLRKAERIAVV